MQLKFKWTDELVQEFTREVAKGQNAMFKGCPKLSDKITAFKRIHSTHDELMKSAIRAMSERKFQRILSEINKRIGLYELLKSEQTINAWYYDMEITYLHENLYKICKFRAEK
jgi:hypothetical protein